MMGGKGTETELYSQNSADLKQLANEENIFRPGDLPHFQRRRKVDKGFIKAHSRGSEKILDNCDFYGTMSQIQEEKNLDAFKNDLGFLHLWDKRGSGKTVEVIHQFNPYRLRLEDSGIEPAIFREPLTKKARKTEMDF
jgi:hypothetical protein